MIRVLLFAVCLGISSTAATGQACIPMWADTGYGIIPDTITNMPPAYSFSPYDITVQFKVPATVDYNGSTINIHHIQLDSMGGLSSIPTVVPFYFQCNPADCAFYPDSVGCVRIQGTPSVPGIYPLVMSARVFITATAGIPFPTPGYEIVVNYPIGIEGISQELFKAGRNQPNPFGAHTVIPVHAEQEGSGVLVVTDVLGKAILVQECRFHQGMNQLVVDMSRQSTGVYSYHLRYGNHSLAGKMVVAR